MRTLRFGPLVTLFIWMTNVVLFTLALAERPITGRELVLPFPVTYPDCGSGCSGGATYTVSSGTTGGNVFVDASGNDFASVHAFMTRDELLRALRTVPAGQLEGVGYVGDDGDWHALTEADLRGGTCICSTSPAVKP